MRTTISRAGRMVLATLAAGCAPGADPTIEAAGQSAIPDSPITEREQYEGSIDPLAAEDHTEEPSSDVDGPIEGLAPRLDTSMVVEGDDGTGVHIDATTACRNATGYSAGRPVSICVTEVDGKLVEYRTAEAYRSMKAAAARAGVRLQVVSGWRTMEQQRYLYNCYVTRSCNGGNLAARPGYSNHQSGLALDLNSSASGVANWLANNGSRFGFRRTVPSEPWHWERPAGSQGSAGNSDRCWSTTLGREMPARACVQSRSDSRWYQCASGLWRVGQGSQGACNGTHPLGASTPTTRPETGDTCYSSTRTRDERVGVCVQSRFDRIWYQCTRSGWVHSASLPSSGAVGACSARHPL